MTVITFPSKSDNIAPAAQIVLDAWTDESNREIDIIAALEGPMTMLSAALGARVARPVNAAPRHTAALSRPPDDPDLAPHARLRNIADTLAAMVEAGEFAATRDDTRRLMGQLPLDLLDIAGQVLATKGPTR